MAGETASITIMALVGLLLFSSLAIEGASAQQTNDPLVGVTTDKAFYNYGDSVTIFGVVRPVTSDTIHIEVQDPEGQVYEGFNADVNVDANGSFRYTSEIPYSLVPGTFLLTATYEGYTANNLFYVSDIYIPHASIDVNIDKAIYDPESRSLEVRYSWTVSGGIKVDSRDVKLETPDGTIITDMCQSPGSVRVMLYFPDGKMVASHISDPNGVSGSCDADAKTLTISGFGGLQDFSGKATMGIYTIKAYYGTASVTRQFVVVEDNLAEGRFDQDEEGNVHFVPYENGSNNSNNKQLHIGFNMVERSDYILVRVENHEENNDSIESVIVKFIDEDGRTTLTPDAPIEPGDIEYFKLAKSPHPGDAETRKSGSLAVWSAYNAGGELLQQRYTEVV